MMMDRTSASSCRWNSVWKGDRNGVMLQEFPSIAKSMNEVSRQFR